MIHVLFRKSNDPIEKHILLDVFCEKIRDEPI